MPINEKMMPIRPGINGRLYKKERPELTSVNYITVESLDETVKKIKGLGGKIIQPKQEVPTVGAFVIALDPKGNPKYWNTTIRNALSSL